MFEDLVIHPQTRSVLVALAKNPPHALLLTGPIGIGKSTLANAWAAIVTKNNIGLVIEIKPDDKNTLSIDAIRNLYQITRNKQDGHQVVLIDHAELMGHEAQNAFLKLLEEPRGGLTFVLSSVGTESLLPTVISRLQHVVVQLTTSSDLSELVSAKQPDLAPSNLAQMLFIANGRPGVLIGMLNDAVRLQTELQRMTQAKHLLTAGLYERYSAISQLSKDRTQCQALLEAMLRIAKTQLFRTKTQTEQTLWIKIADSLQVALERITRNGNLRAQLLYLFSSY
ncbi:MAG TPA: AAA family ATPase [Patescibacteria group bacterium]|jgi:replication-associated recombination protein RarA|nr:AAA family ATPase [Patescibacteria group bacterium]